MKRIVLALVCAACITTMDAKTFVAYFSATGTTKAAATQLAKQHNAVLWEIEPAQPYTAADLDWRNDKSRSSIEMNDPEERPAIKQCTDVTPYDTIFVGFPIWWGICPRIINSWLDNNLPQLEGKTMIPFATSGSSGIEEAEAYLKKTYPTLKWQKGLLLNKRYTMATIYDFKALSNRGKEVNLADYKGQVILIVNTASKCGFTPQYDGLEELYKKYKEQGFVILGFPCDQFANQEPGSDEQIEEFCRLNHGVTFPLMAKSDVNGANANPVFEFLKEQAPTEEYNGLKAKAAHAMLKRISKSVEKPSDILWNFTKFLVSKDGKTIQRFAPVAEPKDFEQLIVAELAK